MRTSRPTNAQLGAWIVLALLGLATVIGVITLRASDQSVIDPLPGAAEETEAARVVAVEEGGCRFAGGPGGSAPACVRVFAELRSGPREGEVVGFDVGASVGISRGDGVRLVASGVDAEAFGGVDVDPYALSDFERRPTLLIVAAAFALLLLVTTRLKGLRALVALTASLAVILAFIVPAIADGSPPVTVALFGALAVMLLTILITHGIGIVASAAALGTAVALGIAVVLADWVTRAADISGFAQEDAVLLAGGSDTLSLRGLLVAGTVIGALGVLDDLTISQASTVMAIRSANPALGPLDLFRRASGVGHDHIVATINTLALAYAGAALPTLLIFSVAGTGFSEAVNSEIVATEIAAAAIGGMALILAAPITTGLATLLASQTPPESIAGAADAHGHAH